jgi:hypothetical protein
MPWTRLGLVYAPSGEAPWSLSHAALPVPIHMGGDAFRFFFSTRDAENRSSVSWVDVMISETPRVIAEAQRPALAPGAAGAFDDSGIGLGNLVAVEHGFRAYYMGWNLGVRAPWRNAIGLATVRPPLDVFDRFSAGPILDRSPEDPYSLTYPWVLRLAPDDWRVWYGSFTAWGANLTDMRVVVKVARSRDGIRWRRDGATVIGFTPPEEFAVARPTVIALQRGFLMGFDRRSGTSRIDFSWSTDAESWTPVHEMGLAGSGKSWDGEMVCYAALFAHRGRLWLAHNGNRYGATGFGLAVWNGGLPFATDGVVLEAQS